MLGLVALTTDKQNIDMETVQTVVRILDYELDRRTIMVEQRVEKNSPRIVKYLKTAAAKKQVDLHPDVAEYLQRYATGKTGLLFHTANGTPHLYGNLDNRWLTARFTKMGLDEKGMGWHSFRRFRKTWLRGALFIASSRETTVTT